MFAWFLTHGRVMTVNPCKIFTIILIIIAVLFVYNITNTFSNAATQTSIARHDVDDQSHQNVIRLWFFALDCDKPHLEFYAKQAVLSALHFTNLVPVLMLHCHNEELESWMQKHDVIIIDPRNSKLVQYLDTHPERLTNLGASTWYRIAIPTVIDELLASNDPRIISLQNEDPAFLQYALYTDADIVFLKGVHIARTLLPRYFALPVQGDAWCCSDNIFSKKVHTNAGVILMNVTSFREIEGEFTDYVLENIVHNKPGALSFNDQTAFHAFFPIRLNHLSWIQILHMGLYHTTYFKTLFTKYYSDTLPKIYEWEPYLGVNSDAVILHWHGPKVFINTCAQLQQPPYKTNSHANVQKIGTTITNSSTYPQNATAVRTVGYEVIPPMIREGVNRSMFADHWQIVLHQLLLFNRSYPYSAHPPTHLPLVHHNHLRHRTKNLANTTSVMQTAISSTLSPAHAMPYPPMYDWYTPMQLNDEDERSIRQIAKHSMFYLQTLTPQSLDGYHHATSLFFSYVNILCSSLN